MAIAVTGGTVLANTNAQEGENGRQGFVSRVATILGLGEDEVQKAFSQSRQEMQEQGLQNKMDKLFENGTLTEEQVAEYKEWLEARPEGLDGLPFVGRRGRGFGFGRHGMNSDRMLGRLFESGRLTEKQVADYREWLEARPDGLDMGGRGFFKRGFRHGRHNFGQGFGGRGQSGSSAPQISLDPNAPTF